MIININNLTTANYKLTQLIAARIDLRRMLDRREVLRAGREDKVGREEV